MLCYLILSGTYIVKEGGEGGVGGFVITISLHQLHYTNPLPLSTRFGGGGGGQDIRGIKWASMDVVMLMIILLFCNAVPASGLM